MLPKSSWLGQHKISRHIRLFLGAINPSKQTSAFSSNHFVLSLIPITKYYIKNIQLIQVSSEAYFCHQQSLDYNAQD